MTLPVAPYLTFPWNVAFLRITFAGILVAKGAGQSGYENGDILSIEWGGPLFNLKKGPDGSATFNATNDHTFTATLRLQQGTSTNDQLSAIVAADELSAQSSGGVGIGQLVVADLFGTTLFEASVARLVEWPKLTFQGDEQPREWKWMGQRDVINVGSNIPVLPFA